MFSKLSAKSYSIIGVIVIAILVMGFILNTNAKTNNKQASAYSSAAVEVVIEPAALSSLPSDGAFYMKGQVYLLGTLGPEGEVPSDAECIGTWHCWGYANSAIGDTVESQSFVLNGYRGIIQVQGPEGFEVLPITGGTGSFKGVRGQATFKKIEGTDGSYQVYFDFVEDQVCDHAHCQQK